MRVINIVIGFLIGFIVGSFLIAHASNISVEKVFNRVFNSTLNTLNIKGV